MLDARGVLATRASPEHLPPLLALRTTDPPASSLGGRIRPDGDRIWDQDGPPFADEPDLKTVTAASHHLSRVVPPVPTKRSATRQKMLPSGERGHVCAVDVDDRHVDLLGAPEEDAQPSPTILAVAVWIEVTLESRLRDGGGGELQALGSRERRSAADEQGQGEDKKGSPSHSDDSSPSSLGRPR
jgi:hypothetical protein